jgi:TPR repeat protein
VEEAKRLNKRILPIVWRPLGGVSHEKAAAKDNVDAMVHLGAFYDSDDGVPQDYTKAREWYEKAAAKDDAEAMYNVGVIYENGYGVPEDYVKAREWYEKAAAKDYSDAMVGLGVIYGSGGYGVPQDHVKALQWYEKAAAKRQEGSGGAANPRGRNGRTVC